MEVAYFTLSEKPVNVNLDKLLKGPKAFLALAYKIIGGGGGAGGGGLAPVAPSPVPTPMYTFTIRSTFTFLHSKREKSLKSGIL